MSDPTSKAPFPPILRHLRILDLTVAIGAFSTCLLSDLGAEVIRIEAPEPAMNQAIAVKADSAYENAGKKSITLDLEQPAGRKIFLDLLRTADALVDSLPTDWLDQRSLGYNALSQVQPKLIQVSLSPYGTQGPRANQHADHLAAAAAGGQMLATGDRLGAPLKLGGHQADYTASLYAAIAILLARRKLAQEGRGRRIDISLQECTASSLEHVLPALIFGGTLPRREGAVDPRTGYCLLPCRDGFIQINVYHQFDTLVAWMDSEGMAADLTDPKWSDESHGRRHFTHLVNIITHWTRCHTQKELVETAQLMHLAWAEVQSPADMLHCPQLAARRFFHPVAGSIVSIPGLPFTLDGWRPAPGCPAPARGQHNREVLHEQMGLDRAAHDELVKDKAI
jgi:crotonobetainyl-CoA:carnitine CoA-transferase CaiB-like acyl-CoA transferase